MPVWSNIAAGDTGLSVRNKLNQLGTNAAREFNVMDFGAVGDGTTNDYTAVAAAVTAIVANKGGTLVFPYRPLGYALGSSVVINTGLYAGGGGITLALNGNTFTPTHTGWCFDVPTNYFGTNNGAIFGQKPVYIIGDGATINGTSSALGGIRLQDTVAWKIQDIAVNNYTTGTAVQLLITSNDLSTWNEHGQLSRVRGSYNLNGIYGKSTNSTGSFLGNRLEDVVFEGKVNNHKNFNFEGLWFDSLFINCGGYVNQLGATGGACFYLNGGFTGATFINPYVDVGNTGTQSAASDIVFGPNYTATLSYQPTIINPLEINLPNDWWNKLIVPSPVLLDGTLGTTTSGNPRMMLRSARTFYVSTTGSDTTNDGMSAAKPLATIQKAIDIIYQRFDCAGQVVTIQLADGTYTGGAAVRGEAPGLGAGSLTLLGNTTTPGNVIISPTNSDAVAVYNGGRLVVKGIEVRTTTSGRGMRSEGIGSYLFIDTDCRFGACANEHAYALNGGVIEQGAAYTITGNAPTHYQVAGGTIIKGASVDATNRAFASNFANVFNQGNLLVNNSTFTTTGSTGTRYYVYAGGLIQTYGAGTSIFPGAAAGFADAGQFAQYL